MGKLITGWLVALAAIIVGVLAVIAWSLAIGDTSDDDCGLAGRNPFSGRCRGSLRDQNLDPTRPDP